jgi:precorrin-6B methylase 2
VDKTKPIGLGTCSVTIKIIQNNLEFIRIIQNNSEIFRVIQNNLEAITIQVLTGP